MKTGGAWAVSWLLLSAAAVAEEPATALTRGKLEADMGRYTVAAEAFAAVAASAQSTEAQRAEALVRLGVARRDAGDATGSVAALEQAFRDHREDAEALRLVLLALGRALPDQERWNEVYREVALDVDRRNPERPQVRVHWPGEPVGLCPCSGTPVTLDLKDGSLLDVFRLFADVSGLNVVVQPGVHGGIHYQGKDVPWDEALERMLAPHGYVARLEGNVLWIGLPGEASPRRTYAGEPSSLWFQEKELVEALREVAAYGGASVEVADGVTGQVTIKLDDVRWDLAFDLIARTNGLTWTRSGDVIRVDRLRRHGER